MPQQQLLSQHKMKGSAACHCCPYGFHIDRDFVRYCDSLYNNTQLEKLKQHKREKRKEKKSVESYLGLTSLISFDLDKPSNQNIAQQPKNYTSDLFLNCDSLKDAVTDFEDTWQKSLKKSSSCHTVIEKKNSLKFIENIPTTNNSTATHYPSHINSGAEECLSSNNGFANVHSRSSSTSSISSHSTTVSSIGIQVPFMQENANSASMFQDIAATMASLSHAGAKSLHNTVGIRRSVLTCIRDQMATSLCQMKDLEEQVKSLPALQVKLSALEEEKKALLLQLQSRENMLNDVSSNLNKCDVIREKFEKLEHEDTVSTKLVKISSDDKRENLSSPAIAYSLDAAIEKNKFIAKEFIPHLKLDSNILNYKEKKDIGIKNIKSIGISCSVLTRDIGVGCIPSKFKSIGVGTDSTLGTTLCMDCKQKKHLEQSTSMSSESLESDIDSVEDGANVLNNLNRRYINSSRGFAGSIHTSVLSNISVHIGVGTEVKCVDKSINTDLKHSDVISKQEIDSKKLMLKNKSTFCVFPMKLSKAVQTFGLRSCRNFGVQTTKLKIDSDVIGDNSEIRKHDAEDNIIDSLCKKNLPVRVKSVAVGNSNMYDICDKCNSHKKNSRACGNSSTCDSHCSKCILRQTETIGVGDNDVNTVICQKCQNEKPFLLKEKCETQSIGINTISDSLNSLNNSDSAIHICDKCSATIHSVAQDLAASTMESKIPRLNLPSTSSLMVSKQAKQTRREAQPVKSKSFTVEKATKVKEYNDQETAVKMEKRFGEEQFKNIVTENVGEQNSSDSETTREQCLTESKELDLQLVPSRSHAKVELSKEVKAACKVLNDYLQKPGRGSEKKIISSSRIIQNEWFRVANQKHADPLLIESYLDSFEEISKPLLHRIVNLSDTNGNTALHYAVSYGNFDVVSILIDSKVCDFNKQNKAGYTSIMLVALADMKTDAHHYVVQRLFSIGDINIKAIQNGQTALMLAVSHGKKDIAKMLLDVGAEINLQDKDGSTALMCAAEHGHLDIVKLLLSHPECDPHVVDGDDSNALTIAMEAGHKDIGLLIYANMNFSRGSSPYSTLKTRKRSTPRSTPPPRTPTLRTPPPPSPSARSTNSIPSSFHFHN